MLEYCQCGSIMVQGSCTNKHCSNRAEKVPVKKARSTTSVKAPVIKAEPKNSKVRRASKCITYNIKDLPKAEE